MSALLGDLQSADTNGYQYEINGFYYGNEYYMFVYNTNDIRLVAAPPKALVNTVVIQITGCGHVI